MIRMGKESATGPEEVIEKAVAFFGPQGVGLKVSDEGDCCARFEGAGGYVYVESTARQGKKGSQITIEGREWETQIRQFIGQL